MSFVECDHWIVVTGADRELAEAKITFKLNDIKVNRDKYSWVEKSVLKDSARVSEGIKGELAVARYLKLDWGLEHDLRDNRGSDLEFGIEVKATSYPSGNLYCSDNTLGHYIRRSSKIPVVCARVGFWPIVEFPGWIFSGEIAKFPFQANEHKHNRGYLVPSDKLKPMNELEDLIAYWKKNFSNGKYDILE